MISGQKKQHDFGIMLFLSLLRQTVSIVVHPDLSLLHVLHRYLSKTRGLL